MRGRKVSGGGNSDSAWSASAAVTGTIKLRIAPCPVGW